MRTVAIIQGRMGSSRLPGKVLLDIAGKPMIQHVVERVRRARALDAVLVATTSDPSDDPVAGFCCANNIPHSRGSLYDVLDRYYRAAQAGAADVVVRITADCPLVDPALLDSAVETLLAGGYDFVANRLPPPFQRSYPIGLDVEVCTLGALECAWREATEAFQREHVMPFLYQGVELENLSASVATGVSARGFKIALLNHTPDYGSLRWTVDTPEDLAFVREVFSRLGDNPNFTWGDVLEIVQKEPELARINSDIQHKSMTDIDKRTRN